MKMNIQILFIIAKLTTGTDPSAPAGIKHFILDPAISFHPGTEEFYSDQPKQGI